MTKIDIFSGFLGAGKTTLIKKLISEAYKGEKIVLIENEFGDIGIDGGFLQDAGINITEMNSGCICCSLVGDFGKALVRVLEEYSPSRIVIEPSGVGKLSDVIKAVTDINSDKIQLNAVATVADVNKCKMYMKNFGEFFNNQIENANTIILSHTGGVADSKLEECVKRIKEHNPNADILTTPWEQLNGIQILEMLEKKNTIEDELKKMTEEAEICPVCGCHDHEHHHHHDDDGDEHCCNHEHHHHDGDGDEHCCNHEHHHHHDGDGDEHCCDHEHHHHHDDGEHCCDHEHHHHHDDGEHCCDHEHHHHHHADEVFSSFGAETGRKYTADEITAALNKLSDVEKYGTILRAKGIVAGAEGFIHFDYVPGEPDVRFGTAVPTGRLCVIGSGIKEDALKELFML